MSVQVGGHELTDIEARAFRAELSRIREQKLYRNEEWLREIYHEQGGSIRDIAAIADVHNATVHSWMERLGVERRSVGERQNKYASFCHHAKGYEKWSSYTPSTGKNRDLLVHRLAAVAWYGFDAVAGNDVHHRNSVPWDNRESNLEPLSKEEHARLHGKERGFYSDFEGSSAE